MCPAFNVASGGVAAPCSLRCVIQQALGVDEAHRRRIVLLRLRAQLLERLRTAAGSSGLAMPLSKEAPADATAC